jgi:hypothetical protein
VNVWNKIEKVGAYTKFKKQLGIKGINFTKKIMGYTP